MSKEELEQAPLVRLSISGNIIGAIVAVVVLLGSVIMYTASKTDAGQVKEIVNEKMAPIMEKINNLVETSKRIETKLDTK